MSTVRFPCAPAIGGVVRMTLLQWLRARILVGLIALAACLVWYGHTVGQEWAHTGTSVAAWTGTLAGYDALARWRADGTLRDMLLTPASPLQLCLGFLLAGAMLGVVILGGTAVAALALGDVATGASLLRIMAVLVLANIAFLGYALAASAFLSRDVSAVFCIGVIIFGAGAPDHWSQAGLPLGMGEILQAFFSAVPTSYQVQHVLDANGTMAPLGLLVAFAVTGVAGSTAALTRPSLLRVTHAGSELL